MQGWCCCCERVAYQRQGVLILQHAVDVVDDLPRVIIGDLAGPAGPDALGAVHQHHGDDGNVPLGLHLLVVVKQELEQVGVDGREQGLGKRTELGMRGAASELAAQNPHSRGAQE